MTHDRTELTTTPMDASIKTMFDRRTDRAYGAGLRAQILSATVVEPQARRWPLRLPFDIPQALPRAVVLALLAAALVGIGLLGVAVLRLQPPAPTGYAPEFIKPFEYVAPAEATFRQTVVRRELAAWSSGPHIASTLEPNAVTPLAPDPWDARGIYVASGAEAWAHGPAGRFMLRTEPAEFLADLRDQANVDMSDVVETTLDRRPAVSVMLAGTGGSDVHLTGRMQGLSLTFVFVNVPARLMVADIDGTTVFVLIWARTAADLDAWMPIANEFVESIRFIPEGQQ